MINLNSKDVNDKKSNLITLYPFNGNSPYLIDKFYIIGYNYLTLEKMLITETPKVIKEEQKKDFKEKDPHDGSFDFEEEPSILNEITNDYSKEGLAYKTLMQMIFAKKLKCHYTWKEIVGNRTVKTYNINNKDINDFKEIEGNKPISKKLVFSSNPQTGKNSKKSINGIAFISYFKFKQKKIYEKREYTYYIPYTFCITSEYPYFSSFSKLLECIHKLYTQKNIYIPIEIIMYYIISLSPSPLKADVVLDLNKICSQEKIFGQLVGKNNKENKESIPKINDNSNNVRDSLKNQGQNEEKGKNKQNRSSIQFKNNSKEIEDENKYIIEFNSLSGYPLIQYNLPKVLFNSLSIDKIIEIFLFMFLEKDVLFFSKNIELLTLTINAFLNLSFPLNDEKYYFIGCAISFDDFIRGDSDFGIKNYTSVIGINDSYQPNYKNKNIKIEDHLAVDLDKGEVIYNDASKNENNVNNNNKKLIKIIEKMCKDVDYNKIKSITLYQAINKLSKHLKQIYKKVYDSSTKSIPLDFLDFNNDILKSNKYIQESFYEFNNNICLYFYENLTVKTKLENQKPQIQEIQKKNNEKEEKYKEQDLNVLFDTEYLKSHNYEDQEKTFLEELKTTMKYESFVYGFLQSYNPINLYKIPLTFTEEFLSIISRKKVQIRENDFSINFFDLIDSLYLGKKSKTKKLDFLNYMISYFKNFKPNIDRQIFEANRKRYNCDNTKMVTISYPLEKKLIYQTVELDDKILLNYLHITKNLSLKDYISYFSETSLNVNNALNEIDIANIENSIEMNCIKHKILTNSDICCTNILLLFTMCLTSLRETISCHEFLSLLFQKFTVFRKYYSILLKMIYKLFLEGKDENSKISSVALCFYPCINSIRNNKLVPNEELMNMIKIFNEIDTNKIIMQENNIIEEKKENQENIDLYGEKLEEKEINNKNLYAFHNFNSKRFFNEKLCMEKINETNMDYFEDNNEKIYPSIRFNNGIHKHECKFISQKYILNNLMKECKKYMETLDVMQLSKDIILDSCLNIFIYVRNTTEFEGMDDIFQTLNNIFYCFMNQLLILKPKKENEIK